MMTALSLIVTGLGLIFIVGSITVIITDNQDSGRKIAWILLIVLIPVVGLLLYIIFGLNFRKAEFFQARHKDFIHILDNEINSEVKDVLFGHSHENEIEERYRELSVLSSRGRGMTVTSGNGIEIITDGKRKLEALIEDIKNAKHHIHVEYFYFRKDKGSRIIKGLLMKKASEGVKVRFIHENIANIDIRPSYYNEMKKAGVEVVRFTNPSRFFLAKLNYRDHRKIVVIDGKIGYTGGMNIGDDYFFRWRDTHMRLTGNAVAELQCSFLNSFITSGGRIDDDINSYFRTIPASGNKGKLIQIVPDEPDKQWPILQMGAVWAVQHSRDYLYIQTPYFVPPESLLQAIKASALKGCDVRIMLPEKSDTFYMSPANRSFYQECLEAGVRIFEKSGNFIHSKTLVADDYLSVIGSANMDYRSLELNYEINAYIYDRDIAAANRAIFMKDMELCTEITPESWKKRPFYKKIFQPIIRLFAPVL